MEITYCGEKGNKLLVKINGGEPMLLTIDELYKLSSIDENQTNEELDWQSLRNQAAIAAMQGALANCYLNHTPHIRIAKQSVLYADALIEVLKEKANEISR